jgi:hypothetical protein
MRLAVTCFLALSAVASAQTTTIIPSSAATTQPTLSPFYTSNVFYSTTSTTIVPASRSQTIVDTADIGTMPKVWKSLEVRRPIGLGNNNPAITTTATVVMSVSTLPWTSSTTDFAANHGTSKSTVISGSINLPAAVNQSNWPAPWQPAFPFAAPFVFTPVAGGSLVLDITQVQATGQSSWYMEYVTPDVGGRATNGSTPSTCKFSNNNYNSSLSYTTGGLNPNGGTWYLTYGNLLPNVVGLVTLSAYGMDNKGPWPLPIDLTAAGAPGCNWYVGLELGFLGALTASSTGSARWPNITIPAGLGGKAFYDHSIWLDPAANKLGIVVGWSSKWSIGTGIGAPSAFVYATGNSYTNSTGTRVAGGCPVFQFQ